VCPVRVFVGKKNTVRSDRRKPRHTTASEAFQYTVTV
jgi:hypothetical protein